MNKLPPKTPPSPGARWCEHGQHWHILGASYSCGEDPEVREKVRQYQKDEDERYKAELAKIPVVTSFYLSDDIETSDLFKAAQIDYQVLLKKYIGYIGDVEGTDYILIHDHRYMSEVKFTEEEWQELKRLAQEFKDQESDGQNAAP